MSDDLLGIDDLITLGDLDELVRAVYRLADRWRWDDLLHLRDRCRMAHSTGRQLWPAAALAEYIVTLEAPPAIAAAVAADNSGRFVLGPLTEVLASRATWAEVADHLPRGPERSFVAHERVLRGEDLRADASIDPAVIDLPLVLQSWEPPYTTVDYRRDRAEHLVPHRQLIFERADDRNGEEIGDDDVDDALRDLVEPWITQSNGRLSSACVEGSPGDALGALGIAKARIAPITAAEAVDLLMWAASSGGAHGRRRGGARARQSVWWLLAALAGAEDPWSCPDDEIDQAMARLDWYVWDAGEPDLGWQLRLTVRDPIEDLSWAWSAIDAE